MHCHRNRVTVTDLDTIGGIEESAFRLQLNIASPSIDANG
jgi:hypothetical protein